jgi:hypothetical protein
MGEDSSPGPRRTVISMFDQSSSLVGRDASGFNVCGSYLFADHPRMPGYMREREAHDVA